MPYYKCKLMNEEGSVFSHSLIAHSREDCRKHFEEEGLCVLSVKKEWKKVQISFGPGRKKIKDKDFILFNEELIALLKAGYTVLKSIKTIMRRIKNIYFKELLIKIEKSIREGKSLSEAFAPFERNFSTIYISSLMAGEKSGNLPDTLKQYNNYAKVISQTKKKIKSAVSYPVILLAFSLLLLGVLINFVIPRFADFYGHFDAELPFITRGIMAFSLTAKRYFYLLIALAIVLYLVYVRLRRKEGMRIFLGKLKIKTPYLGMFLIESGISHFCRTLSLLLRSGISLIPSIKTAKQAVSNKFLLHRMRNVAGDVENGESLSHSLSKTGFFYPMALDLVRIGETSANLDGMLKEVADFYDERIRVKIDTLVSLIEPIIIIFIGLVAAAMLLSVYLPIFNIIRVVR